MMRCPWSTNNPLMQQYHDERFGVPVTSDTELFKMLVLELNQAGLSWQTVLNKEAAFDEAFDQFDLHKVAAYDETKVAALLTNAGIIRHRKKIAAAITNAQAILKIQKDYGSFQAYLWDFVGGATIVNHWTALAEIPSKTELSDRLSRALKKQGFAFVGSTTLYSFLQATGFINDHLTTCFRYQELQK